MTSDFKSELWEAIRERIAIDGATVRLTAAQVELEVRGWLPPNPERIVRVAPDGVVEVFEPYPKQGPVTVDHVVDDWSGGAAKDPAGNLKHVFEGETNEVGEIRVRPPKGNK